MKKFLVVVAFVAAFAAAGLAYLYANLCSGHPHGMC